MDTVIERRAFRRKRAARYIDVGLTSFHDLINQGELPPGTILSGSIKIWMKEDLDAFLERKRLEQREVHHA